MSAVPGRVGVIIPALNEEGALPLVLAELPGELVDRVIVVDNGSEDRTAELARAGGAFVVPEPERGYGSACLAGLAALYGTHPEPDLRIDDPWGDGDIVVFLDADHSDYPEELPQVIAPIVEDRADFVIGSRILGGARMDAMLPQAWFGNRLACFLMRVLFGLRATDLGPFRALRVGALRHIDVRDRTFGWTVEMQLKAHQAELRTVEVPVRYRARIGESKITGTLWGTLGAARKILGWIFGWRLRAWFTRRRIPRYLPPGHSESR